ncbi:MAG: hypothetical protein ACR2NP_13375 [Pirellulaceae bacterium]
MPVWIKVTNALTGTSARNPLPEAAMQKRVVFSSSNNFLGPAVRSGLILYLFRFGACRPIMSAKKMAIDK